jgi:hypothetical protein
MPSKTPKQAKLMNIAAHTKGGYGGVPQSVGKEFHNADKALRLSKNPPPPRLPGRKM